MKAAVALSDRKSDAGLVGSVFVGPVEAGREISLGFARPESDAAESFASLGWSRDGSSVCVDFGGSWFMAEEWALSKGDLHILVAVDNLLYRVSSLCWQGQSAVVADRKLPSRQAIVHRRAEPR